MTSAQLQRPQWILNPGSSAGAAIVALAGLWPATVRSEEAPARQPRALCIGMGGGSLPMFLAHHFPGMQVMHVLEELISSPCAITIVL